jgi:hypothetical protein
VAAADDVQGEKETKEEKTAMLLPLKTNAWRYQFGNFNIFANKIAHDLSSSLLCFRLIFVGGRHSTIIRASCRKNSE